jgi:hypothetical protein
MKPTHKHDCDRCIYLGSLIKELRAGPIVITSDNVIDCYWCKNTDNPNLSSIIGRYSSDGPDYASSHPPECFAGGIDILQCSDRWYLFALLQAIRLNLYNLPT